ncbi:NADAR family protein [Ferruginibacter sp. SUN106]|uniref:NADAR family protein n=1 Tax=Ferruginibacter sp. SUN106 TaxID=2978348 RepID=UPI003D36D89D
MNYSLNWLKSQIETGFHPEYLFFWGHTQKATGVTDKSCFSQWWPSPFIVDGITYPTAEHWMMAQKALLFDDNESFDLIIAANKPAIAKDLGRKVKNFDADKWNANAFKLVTTGNIHKFSQHGDLKKFLLNTGDKTLVEASPVDFIWGIGLSQEAPEASNPYKWKGANLLGFALMEVREDLKK